MIDATFFFETADPETLEDAQKVIARVQHWEAQVNAMIAASKKGAEREARAQLTRWKKQKVRLLRPKSEVVLAAGEYATVYEGDVFATVKGIRLPNGDITTEVVTDFGIEVLSRQFQIDGDAHARYQLRLHKQGGKTIVIAVAPEHAQSLDKFQTYLNADFNFFGTSGDLKRINSQLISTATVPDTYVTSVLGMHTHPSNKTKCWVSTSGVWQFNGESYSVVEDLTHDVDHAHAMKYSSTIDPSEAPDLDVVADIGKLLFGWNESRVTYSVVGWYVANFFKTAVTKKTGAWPILYTIGEAGSGKTETTKAMMFMYSSEQHPEMLNNFMNITNYSARKLAGSSNTLPLILDEIKPKDDGELKQKMWLELVNTAYNLQTTSRGTKTGEIESWSIQSPIHAIGEKTVGDQSTLERCVCVYFDGMKKHSYSEAWAEFKELPLHKLGQVFLQLAMDEGFVSDLLAKRIELEGLVDKKLADRQRYAASVIAMGLYVVDIALGQSTPAEELVERASMSFYADPETKRIRKQKSAVEQVLEVIDVLIVDSSARDHLEPGQHYQLLSDGRIALHLPTVWPKVMAHCRSIGVGLILSDKDDFLVQLRGHHRCVEINKVVKYYFPGDKDKKLSKPQRSLVIKSNDEGDMV